MTEESYTSGTSFIDNEEPIKKNYNKSRLIYRGLFISNKGIKINADLKKLMIKLTWEEFQDWQRWDEYPERSDDPPMTVDFMIFYEGKNIILPKVIVNIIFIQEIGNLSMPIKTS